MDIPPLSTRYVGESLIHYPSVDSTNRVAQQLIQENRVSHGTVVHADFQTAGRGQQRNGWESKPAQNLTFSLVLFPRLAVDQQHWLTVATALALSDALSQHLSRPVMIKWPNDILCESNKICGILIQNNLKGRKIHSSVIGIGLNVNQDQFTHPQATSLALLTGRHWHRTEVLRELLQRLEIRYDQLWQEKYPMLEQAYLARMFRKGEKHLFEDQQGSFFGTILGIDATGRLTVEVDGTLRYYSNKELRYK